MQLSILILSSLLLIGEGLARPSPCRHDDTLNARSHKAKRQVEAQRFGNGRGRFGRPRFGGNFGNNNGNAGASSSVAAPSASASDAAAPAASEGTGGDGQGGAAGGNTGAGGADPGTGTGADTGAGGGGNGQADTGANEGNGNGGGDAAAGGNGGGNTGNAGGAGGGNNNGNGGGDAAAGGNQGGGNGGNQGGANGNNGGNGGDGGNGNGGNGGNGNGGNGNAGNADDEADDGDVAPPAQDNAQQPGPAVPVLVSNGGQTLSQGLILNTQANPNATAGQAASATSNNNFIDFCQGQTLTNGLQVEEESCAVTPIGQIPSTSNMVSAMFVVPANGDTLPADRTFTMQLAVQGMVMGSFTNAQLNYYSAPQQLDGSGRIVGHAHVVIQEMTSTTSTQVLNPQQFAFFKGLNFQDVNGVSSLAIDGGLPAGAYRICTIMSASNHQSVVMPVAQRGAENTCSYFNTQ